MPQRGGDGFAYAGIGGGGHLFLFVAFLVTMLRWKWAGAATRRRWLAETAVNSLQAGEFWIARSARGISGSG